MTRRERAGVLVVAGLATAAAVLAGCSSGSTPSPPPRSTAPPAPAERITTPVAGQRGPQITVRGTVYWRTNHPGCAELSTVAGQDVYLVGQLATQHEQRAETNAEPASVQVQITGYVPVVEPSVCGPGLPFLVEQVTTVTR
jgi:hypothetical protein